MDTPEFSNRSADEVAAIFLRKLIKTHHHESALSIKPGLETVFVEAIVKCDSIDEISEVDMEIKITFSVTLFWKDSRLAFDKPPFNIKEDFIKVIVLPASMVKMLWVPDFFIEGSKKTSTHSSVHNPTVSMRIF